ncbi:mannose-1-phosphate guanylyltransferase [Terriglobus aquaticus]|uniref:Mannose-1-phosphate guanylyltransferase n=1 Tax=Terriglobus aquaticus TaxID=940139 RepID=A0ABW9KI80_9BACT|nr:sugar phosphate nucleotidyltransferase [Terriglobus aquaticus]
MQPPTNIDFVPVILAGGSGTRFWPRSRKARAKQVLALSGEETMIQQTVERLRPLAQDSTFLVITNDLLAETIGKQLPNVPAARILREPAARNTAPACLLAAAILAKSNPQTVLGIFPSDHVVLDDAKFVERMQQAIQVAAAGENIVVLGAPPTRPETGYGYIEEGVAVSFGSEPFEVHAVRRFTEKPDFAHARKFLSAGNYTWNSGMFLWSAQTLINAFREHCNSMLAPILAIADAFGTPDFDRVFAEQYPTVENISIDFAILESRSFKGEGKSNIYCLPADFGWNDLGSWSALHEHHLQHIQDIGNNNVVESSSTLQLDASGNYVYAPGLTVALLGVKDLVVVQTDDALLVTTRAHSQEVGRVVKELVKHARHELV